MSQNNTDGINYQSAHFVISAAKLSQCPPDQGSEVAFAGRSNSGKSSAINAITNQKSLARTSKTPGRTQLINFFGLPLPERRLVDLPGYGFAKVNIEMKREWQRHLEDYLRRRRCLRGLVLVMDVRHPLTEFDRMMLAWSYEAGMPVHILLTKADKLKRGPAKNSLLQVRQAVQAEYGGQVTVQLFSALKKDGIDQARGRLDDWLLELPEDDGIAQMP